MYFPELDRWADASCLSAKELARIQPSYQPTLLDVIGFERIICAMTVILALAIISVLFNAIRLVRRLSPRLTTVTLGIVAGVVFFALFFSGFETKPRLQELLHLAQIVALIGGLASFLSATAALGAEIAQIARIASEAVPPRKPIHETRFTDESPSATPRPENRSSAPTGLCHSTS
jgi:hypothetical protein